MAGLLDGIDPEAVLRFNDELAFRRLMTGATDLASVVPPGTFGTLAEAPPYSSVRSFSDLAGRAAIDIGSLPAQIATSMAMQPVTAAQSIGTAIAQPTKGNIGRAAGETALAVLPAAGVAGRAIAPMLKVSPATATIGSAGGLGAAYGAGITTEAQANSNAMARPQEMTRAQFDKAYDVPRPTRRTADQAAREARAAFEASPGYLQRLERGQISRAQKEAGDVERKARQEFRDDYEQQVAQWEQARDRAWEATQSDYNERLKEFNKQGFWSRNPEYAPYAMAAGYALPAMFGAGTAIQKARTLGRFRAGMESDDITTAAINRAAADKYMNPSTGKKINKAALAAAAALAPVEVRAIGDIADAYFGPEGSDAKKRAQEKLSLPNLPRYIGENVPGIIQGAAFYGMGSKLGALAMRDEAARVAAMTAPGVTGAMDDVAAQRVAAARLANDVSLANTRSQGLLDAASINTASRLDSMRTGAEIRRIQDAGRISEARRLEDEAQRLGSRGLMDDMPNVPPVGGRSSGQPSRAPNLPPAASPSPARPSSSPSQPSLPPPSPTPPQTPPATRPQTGAEPRPPTPRRTPAPRGDWGPSHATATRAVVTQMMERMPLAKIKPEEVVNQLRLQLGGNPDMREVRAALRLYKNANKAAKKNPNLIGASAGAAGLAAGAAGYGGLLDFEY